MWSSTNSAIAVTAALVLTAQTTVSATASLDALQWSKRALVVFSPSRSDDRARSFDAMLSAASCEIEDRDLTVIRVASQHAAADPEAQRLRMRFDVEPHDFRIVLIGKDGGEKLRLDEVPELSSIFALIDGMPMRRAEMREQDRACSQ